MSDNNLNKCLDVEIPEVDESPLECDTFYSADCIVVDSLDEEIRAYFSLGDSPNLTEVLTAISLSLIDIRQRVINLENQP